MAQTYQSTVSHVTETFLFRFASEAIEDANPNTNTTQKTPSQPADRQRDYLIRTDHIQSESNSENVHVRSPENEKCTGFEDRQS